MTKLSASLPKGDGNGLTAISRELIDHPDKVHVVIMLLKTKSLATEVESGDVEAKAYIRRLEVVIPADHPLAFRMLERALEHRTGATTLPFELEQDLRAAFTDLADLDALLAGEVDEEQVEADSTGDAELDMLLSMVSLVVTEQNAAVSFLTRQLNIGATRAKRMLERLEQLLIVTPADGAKPRNVLVYPEDLPALLARLRAEHDAAAGGADDGDEPS